MQICNRCVMSDKSDEYICFDELGYCNYCTEELSKIGTTTYFPNEEGKRRLDAMLQQIKKDGEGKAYDCVMGISGGLDSSYLAYLGSKWQLRILALHIDDGFDTEISKQNMKKLVEATGIDLRVISPDPTQFYALTKAYMKAGVPNLAIPQDNILFAFLYDFVRKNKIKYFLSGGNFSLESVLQQGNTYNAMDIVNIKAIHKKFGTQPITHMKLISSYQKYFDNKFLKLLTLRPLNYIDYNRDRAYAELKDFCGFEYYGGKHLENAFTAFVQLYWLPKKFNFDKRSSHLSSMIVSGQITREDALAELEKPLYDPILMGSHIETVKRLLEVSDQDFDEMMQAPIHNHEDYRTDRVGTWLRKLFFK